MTGQQLAWYDVCSSMSLGALMVGYLWIEFKLEARSYQRDNYFDFQDLIFPHDCEVDVVAFTVRPRSPSVQSHANIVVRIHLQLPVSITAKQWAGGVSTRALTFNR